MFYFTMKISQSSIFPFLPSVSVLLTFVSKALMVELVDVLADLEDVL